MVDANGNISLLIMKETEEVVEQDGIIPHALNENQVDLKEWQEVIVDKVPLGDDMNSTGKIEIDRFLQQAMIDGMESPVKDNIYELEKALEAKAKKLKVETYSKESGELKIKHDTIFENGVFTEKPQNKEAEADTKTSSADLARLWTQNEGDIGLAGVNTGTLMQNDSEKKTMYTFFKIALMK